MVSGDSLQLDSVGDDAATQLPLVELPPCSRAGDRLKILYLTHRIPFPLDRGDRIRCHHIIRQLSTHHDLTVAAVDQTPPTYGATTFLEEHCEHWMTAELGFARRWTGATTSVLRGGPITTGYFYDRHLAERIDKLANRKVFDLLLLDCSNMARYRELPSLEQLPCLVDLVDVDSQKWRRAAELNSGLKSVVYRREHSRVEQVERELIDSAAAVMVVSEAEAELLREVHPDAKPAVITNGVDHVKYSRPSDHERSNDLVFVGVLDYSANVDGLLWFAEHVWPGLHKSRPKTTFTIVGKNPVPEIRRLASQPGISVNANVSDVRPSLWNSKLAVIPLRLARGVQNKVLEAMAAHVPVVASAAACGGIAARDQHELVQANDPEEWSATILRLLSDVDERQRLSDTALNYVRDHHSWAQTLAPLDQLVRDTVGARSTIAS
ncbi:D-inositol-3-phosphate glycosyltransferase [Calycomorphotria hydatis]|uniref:D-inositol-3-phosphate glycosyltransferase n=2 Tax=Calycomorphotria hydatis TaxID=2528027 RepID=A0A517T4J8_9PLAN|nr:D-inositol-3-phosphate glycosyltransferase [Calycomorphotria hydatis]